MSCRRFQQRVGEYLDGVLGSDEQIRFERHAADCQECGRSLEDAELALRVLRQAPSVEPPPELVAAILGDTLGSPARAGQRAVAGAGDPAAGAGIFGWMRPLLHPLLEPRLAMSIALSLVSFSLMTLSGQKMAQRWKAGEDPLAIVRQVRGSFGDAWVQGVQVYESVSAWTAGDDPGREKPGPADAPEEPESLSPAEGRP